MPLKLRHLMLTCLLVLVMFSACQWAMPQSSPVLTPAVDSLPPADQNTSALTIFYTSDEHGWLAGQTEGQGAAELAGIWQAEFGWQPDDENFLLVSGGDNWTGPAVSSWFKGQSMVEVMNQMGYAASAVGNHEFDFGTSVLTERTAEAGFPYLSANMTRKSDGAYPAELGIQPYTIVKRAGLNIGIIGLTTTRTAYAANPAIVGAYEFGDYAKSVRQAAALARDDGATVLIVIAHICGNELQSLARAVADLDIIMFGGGHCHATMAQKSGGALLLEAGSNLGHFAYARFSIDPATQHPTLADYGIRKNKGGKADAAVAEIVARWVDFANLEANVVIGYLQSTIPQKSILMQRLITESWLAGYPLADVAMTNLGGMRTELAAGEVTLGDIVAMMPFDNVLIEMHLTGAQIKDVLNAKTTTPPAIGGMHKNGGVWLLNKSGLPLDDQAVYVVLVNDFMYAGGDHYDLLAQFDPQAYNTSIDWRQPLIDWMIAQNASATQPLDSAINRLGK